MFWIIDERIFIEGLIVVIISVKMITGEVPEILKVYFVIMICILIMTCLFIKLC